MAFRPDELDCDSGFGGGGQAAQFMHPYDVDETQFPYIVPESLPFRAPSPLYARDQADAILNSRAQSTAHQQQIRHNNSNVVHGEFASMYPHLERYYDMEDDGDALANIHWCRCNGTDLWNVLVSKHLACGKTSSMAFSFRECLKKLKDAVLSPDLKLRFEEGLKDTNDKHLPTQASLKKDFILALNSPSTLASVQAHMAKYHSNKRIKIKDGLFPKFTDVQINKVRIAAFMVSACTQQLLHAMQNPSQSRAAVDDNETRAVAVRTECYQQFTDIVNSCQSPDHPIIDMVAFNGITVNCSVLLGDPMTLLDVSRTMSDLKRDMAKQMCNFNKSGEGVNGADDYARDCDFYDRFIKGDAVLFAVYLAWDHGRNIPSWNSTLLPEENQMDIGTTKGNSSSNGNKRGRSAVDIVDPGDLTELIRMQTKFFDYALGGRPLGSEGSSSQQSSSCSSNAQRMDPFGDIDKQISALQRLRNDDTLSPEKKLQVENKYLSIIDRFCMTTSDLTA
jgi:hypothetical protein